MEIVEKLLQIMEMKDNPYFAKPSNQAIANTLTLLQVIECVHVSRLTADNISTNPHGTINFEWVRGAYEDYVLVEVGDDLYNYAFEIDSERGGGDENVHISDLSLIKVIESKIDLLYGV